MARRPTGKSPSGEERFADTRVGWAQRWQMEFAAARERVKKWHQQGDRILERYLDERDNKTEGDTRLNVYTSNSETLEALLFGKTPKVDVRRRFNDSDDDIARVGGQILERALNADVEKSTDKYKNALELALKDRNHPGMGHARCVYVCEWGEPREVPAQIDPMTGAEIAPAYTEPAQKTYECVEVVYVPWKDQLWSPARFFDEVRWWAFRIPLTREEAIAAFGEEDGGAVPLNEKKETSPNKERDKSTPWDRVDIWEIWDKEHRCVWWYVDGYKQVLVRQGMQVAENGSQPDPYGLEDFWPFHRPMMANLTTSKYLPRPDFVIAQDLYNQIDQLATRATLLERAIRAAGVYDKNSADVKRLLSESSSNQLYPVEKWAMFAEKGGLKSVVDWFPLDMIVAALGQVNAQLDRKMTQLFQITGFSDIMRGQATDAATATEQAIKAKFGSIRVQRRQDEFAEFAGGLQRVKAELMCKHFDPQTLIEQSNILQTADAKYAQQAVQLLKDTFSRTYRVIVKSESVSLTDYAANKQEMAEVLAAISQTVQNFMPLVQMSPHMLPHCLRILQAFVARLRAGDVIEGILDEAIAEARQQLEQAAIAAQQPKPPPPPDPKVQAAQIKAQGDVAKTHAATQGRLVEIGAETQAAMAQRTHDARMSIAEDEASDRRDAIRELNRVIPARPA